MGYQGGKRRGSDFILETLNDEMFDGWDYLEPFLGYAHILRRVVNKRSYTAADGNPLVAELMKGIKAKKAFPTVSREEYERLKHQRGVVGFKRAVAAFAYSYNGGEWKGYVGGLRGRDRRDYPDEHRRYYAQLADNETFRKAKISHSDYRSFKPQGMLVYCDPPYRNTTAYGGLAFDHDEFWETMRRWSRDNVVFISEYTAPPDFVRVDCAQKRGLLNHQSRDVYNLECLFVHKSCLTSAPSQ